MLRAINVWAWHEDLARAGSMQRVPICSDASVSVSRMGPGGSWVGAAGWHFAFPFSTLSDLANKLENATLPDYIRGEHRTLQRGEVQTLAIDCHGADGEFFPNGLPGIGVNAENLDHFGSALRQIGLQTASQAHDALVPNPPSPFMMRSSQSASSIILVCCNTGAGPGGTALLEQLSYRWPGRRVISFSTTVVIPNLLTVEDPASRETCVPPLVLDSGQHGMRMRQSDAWLAGFSQSHAQNPRRLPFADASAENAKIALNGSIIDWPANEPRRRASLGPQLNGPPRGNTARPTRSAQGSRRLV